MKVKELIKQLNNIQNKERDIQILIGNDFDDSLGCEKFEVMHNDDCEQCVEIFCHLKDCYTDEVFENSSIKIIKNK